MEEQTITTRAEKPNSYEFGKASNRFKLYFETAIDLQRMIDNLKALGLIEDEIKDFSNGGLTSKQEDSVLAREGE